VDDVASAVKLALVENDYAILRRFEGRSSLTTYLAMVITRLMADQYERSHGRWRPSSEAKRRGERAVLIENVIGKQRRTIGEAVPLLQAIDKSITREEVEQLATQLPQRTPRPREVELADENIVSSDRADTAAVDAELRGMSQRAGALLRETMSAWPADDRLLVRLRFESSLTMADAARLLNVPQRPLYRKLESLLARLRETLIAAGIDAATAHELLGASNRIDLDLGLGWKNGEANRTNDEVRP